MTRTGDNKHVLIFVLVTMCFLRVNGKVKCVLVLN
jgi:hypothetical protein